MPEKRCPSNLKIGDKTYHPYPGNPNVFVGEKGKKAATLQCKTDRANTGRPCRVIIIPSGYGYCKMTPEKLKPLNTINPELKWRFMMHGEVYTTAPNEKWQHAYQKQKEIKVDGIKTTVFGNLKPERSMRSIIDRNMSSTGDPPTVAYDTRYKRLYFIPHDIIESHEGITYFTRNTKTDNLLYISSFKDGVYRIYSGTLGFEPSLEYANELVGLRHLEKSFGSSQIILNEITRGQFVKNEPRVMKGTAKSLISQLERL